VNRATSDAARSDKAVDERRDFRLQDHVVRGP
jgi:hypothetical protein